MQWLAWFDNFNNKKPCIICRYWYFKQGFKFQDSRCNGCHGVTMFCLNIGDIAIIAVKAFDYHCIVHDISKSEAIHLLKKAVYLTIVGIYKMYTKKINIKNQVCLIYIMMN